MSVGMGYRLSLMPHLGSFHLHRGVLRGRVRILVKLGPGASMVNFCEWCAAPQLPSLPFSSSVSSTGGATSLSACRSMHVLSLQQPTWLVSHERFPTAQQTWKLPSIASLKTQSGPSLCLASISLAVQLEARDQGRDHQGTAQACSAGPHWSPEPESATQARRLWGWSWMPMSLRERLLLFP